MPTPIECEHANENPNVCPCAADCPCRRAHCLGKAIPASYGKMPPIVIGPNKRQDKRQVTRRRIYFLAARLLDNYLDVGQPWSDCCDGEHTWFDRHTGRGAGTEDCVDCKRMVKQIERLRDQFDDRGKL